MYNPLRPPPAPPGFGEGKVIPEVQASFLSKLVFGWLSPFLAVGFSRPLEKEDLWELPPDRLTANIAEVVQRNFYARCPPEKRPHAFREPESQTSSPPLSSSDEDPEKQVGGEDPEKQLGDDSTLPSPQANESGSNKRDSSRKSNKGEPKYDSSLVKALHTTFFWRWWAGGIMNLIADTLRTTTPLISKLLLTWLADAYVYHRLTEQEAEAVGLEKPRGIGYGIGLGVALFVMQEVASLMTNHYMSSMMIIGLSIRTALVGAIFRKSLRLSGKARTEHSVGQITTLISTDATRLDIVGAYAHNLWIAPIQLIIGIGLLIGTLGYSALVGLGVLLLGFPIQLVLVQILFAQSKKGIKITDRRVRLTNEVLQGVRLIKFYSWEAFFGHRIASLRGAEVETIRKSAMARSLLIAVVIFIPILSAILSFITYSLSGHTLNVATIFTSLQYFNIIRVPLIMLPIMLAVVVEAVISLGRISKFLVAEELDEPFEVDLECPNAVEVEGGGFSWEVTLRDGDPGEKSPGVIGNNGDPKSAEKEKGAKGRKGKKGKGKKKGDKTTPVSDDSTGVDGSSGEEARTPTPFELKDVNVTIPRGSFIAIVGRVGCGKSSFLQALIGEMRKTAGSVKLGGTIGYVPQTAWIMNATLRENITFGGTEDEEKFRAVIQACNLEHDLEMLPHGERTEIGEKGINLSGGQKARVCLARAAYAQPDIVLLDDPLSAVDAWVGKSILQNCLLAGPLADKTRILVTHALHVLDRTDYIYLMDEGVVVEQGTYQDLMANSVLFSRLLTEYGNRDKDGRLGAVDKDKASIYAKASPSKVDGKSNETTLMQLEDRNIGAVTYSTYAKYLKFGGSIWWFPWILLMLVLYEGASVSNNIFLGFWTAQSISGFDQSAYMGVYAALGVAQALFSFICSFSVSVACLQAGFQMFKSALAALLHSPVSFYDTTPIGRIISRLSKDQETIDNELSYVLFQLLTTCMDVLGTISLVFYTFPYLGIIFVPLGVLYFFAAMFYRRSSVETKRLDSLLRSALYAAYNEALTGLSTIRAYGEQDRFVTSGERGLDMENRAYYMTITIQRWLGVRLDFFGNTLIFAIAIFAAVFRTSVNPSKIGVVLTYSLGITQTFSEGVSMFAMNEQNMNAVERILVYTELPAEGSPDPPPTIPPQTWPDRGGIKFTNVAMSYRPGLPLTLRDLTFEVPPGEKVGIVGRTGAGKSSLLQALFRIVELQSGTIEIDGVNINDIPLDRLRRSLALVPQDSTLFLGTLRENLDPVGTHPDAELISALQRAWLLPRDGVVDADIEAKFSLDSPVTDEGGNFSVGEKQLLSLSRAIVKNSRITILDEATSNVDVETDAKLQRTIQSEFSGSTLLCIAHRLNTIAYYDRVLVMDGGRMAEFDSPLKLFDDPTSIFRGLCDEAGLSKEDIIKIREGMQPPNGQ
ncbi:hypothetical protein JAAARDRAFT_40221 [Jaapia argillacea MUCL 33604]|uniref:Multidrug resistance-associated ABC transporter n=1 Tax=Jaapia argillacea MUCL 33604 TaxID=933084 RepID=A0A067PCH0_9AGAM|nr:hypothetical protein JAAARDRAFT_40221 [Jaapia argillacea MUCL 33604]